MAAVYNGDPTNIVLLGGSTGGNLAMLGGEMLDAETAGTVRGIVNLSGPADLVTLRAYEEQLKAESKPASLYQPLATALGCRSLPLCTEAQEREWSPTARIPAAASCPAWYLAGGEADTVLPIAQQREMLAALEAAGCSATLRVVPNGHSFAYWAKIAPEVVAFLRAN